MYHEVADALVSIIGKTRRVTADAMRFSQRCTRCVPPLLSLAAASPLHADEPEPRWEIGFGIAGLTIPDYRGSKEQRQHLLPLPYVSYNGEVFAVDREGVRSELFRSERVRLEASLGAAPPARGEGGARVGMPDLDPVIEAGASLSIDFDARAGQGWSLNFPLRAAVATDFKHTDPIGWIFSPHVKYASGQSGDWRYDVSVGPMYASEEYHDYYYEVAPAFATSARSAYDARAGYSGSRVTFTLSKYFGRFWAGVFARYDNLAGAAFRDSPLLQTEHGFMLGGGIAWIFVRSAQPAPPER